MLLRIKSEQKVLGNLFRAQKIFKNPLKTGFPIRIILLQFVSGVFRLLQVIFNSKNTLLMDYYSLLVLKSIFIEKPVLNGFLKIIGAQNQLRFSFCLDLVYNKTVKAKISRL